MSQRYPGGLISRSAPVVVGPTGSPPEGGSAPGIWTLEQAAGYIKQGLWPKPVIPKELYSWGANRDGPLGINTTTSRSSPVQVGSLSAWSQLSSGGYFSAAITTSGTLFAWGQNNVGQLGQNDTITRSSPVQVGALTTWSKVSAGNYHCVAIKTDGTLWAWGQNYFGNLGQNNTINKSSPVQVGSLTTWSQVSASSGETCAAITTSGTLFTWGRNNYGQLGQNNVINRSSPVQIGALTTWSKIAVGKGIFCAAVTTSGTLFSWGFNAYGQLGQNNTINRSSPVQVGVSNNWAQVSAGKYHCAAITTSGTLFTWGINANGQLGQDNLIYQSSPVQVGALTNWSQVSAGKPFCISIKTDKTLWGWGYNNGGQLGDGTVVSKSSPVQIGSLATWSSISAGSYHTIAIKN